MAAENCPSSTKLLTPDLTAQLTPAEAWTPLSEIKTPSERTISDNAYAGLGRKLLGLHRANQLKSPDFDDLYFPASASLDDWEHLEVEDPKLHHQLSSVVIKEMARQQIALPFPHRDLAPVTYLAEIRSKKQEIQQAQATQIAESLSGNVS